MEISDIILEECAKAGNVLLMVSIWDESMKTTHSTFKFPMLTGKIDAGFNVMHTSDRLACSKSSVIVILAI